MTAVGIDQLNDFENGVESGEEITVEDDPDGDFASGDCEAEAMKIMKPPANPSQQDLGDHRSSHIPYRSWCRWCVLGRGRGSKHVSGPDSDIPVIGLDYFFITSNGVDKRQELMEYPEYTAEGR